MRAVWQLQLNLLDLYSCAPYGSYPTVAFTHDYALVASRECTFYQSGIQTIKTQMQSECYPPRAAQSRAC